MPLCGCFGKLGKSYKTSTSGMQNDSYANENGDAIQISYKQSYEIQSIQHKLEITERNMKEKDQHQVKLENKLKEASHTLRTVQDENKELRILTKKLEEKLESMERESHLKKLAITLKDVIPDPRNPTRHERRKAVIEPRRPLNQLPSLDVKTKEVADRLYENLRENEFLRSNDQLREIIPFIKLRSYQEGDILFAEGDPGDGLYILESGECVSIKNGLIQSTFSPGDVIGEIAILHETTRKISLKATTEVTAWFLERSVYHFAMEKLGKLRISSLKQLVANTPLSKLSPRKIAKIADAVTEEVFSEGSYIIRQGEIGRTFYIIKEGSVDVTEFIMGTLSPSAQQRQEVFIETLTEGQYFGERALLIDGSNHTVNAVASKKTICLSLDKLDFDRLIGRIPGVLTDFKNIAAQVPSTPRESFVTTHLPSQNSRSRLQTKEIQLYDLEEVICMGSGSFGRVYLVKCPSLRKVFALKKIKKHVVVEKGEQENIIREKDILRLCRSNFVVSLFKTFRDERYVYMLMEACMGGDLWGVLEKNAKFTNNRARFYMACTLEALAYLQRKKIVHRDIKLENLLLDERGYLKLADFGYAKIMEPGEKTWTFCGTPHYMAPEIAHCQGYDHAVDFWSIGILLFELLNGNPPFNASSDEEIYSQASLGINAIRFPKDISISAKNLIRQLCKDRPVARLGYLKNGIADIRNHKWFSGFDWTGLRSRTYKPEYVPQVSDGLDTRHFTHVSDESDVGSAMIELSGWDETF